MRIRPVPLILAWLLCTVTAGAQQQPGPVLLLKSGVFSPQPNISPEGLSGFNRLTAKAGGKTVAILQFEQLPSAAHKARLQEQGITLLDYIPNNAYTVTIEGNADPVTLMQAKARSLFIPAPRQKMQPGLAEGRYPAWAIQQTGTIDVWISIPVTFSIEEARQKLIGSGFTINNTDFKPYRILGLRAAVTRLEELAALPFIDYVQAAPAPDKELNSNSMYLSGANLLKAPLAAGGRGLDGEGVVVGIGDNGDVQSHIDISGRLINRAAELMRAHATHVAGTIGGAGIIQELYAGYASKTTLLAQYFSGIFVNAEKYVQDYDMVITNNSFGSVVNDCNYNGHYDLSSRILDQQAIDLPELQQVFASGNNGASTCSPFSAGYRTVLGGYQSAKNVITVGATDFRGTISSFSSRGPVRDGRLKPEIMSMGSLVASTWTSNIYSYNSGTSMAAPGVSGGLALLVQRYRQLNSNANPPNALTKALLCNAGTDRGNAGPDFQYGFGSMNLIRSLEMLENNRYISSTVANSVTNTHTVTVPANTAKLKVMLYWQDPPAAVMASSTLVNDLDLQVVTPGNVTLLPLVLDTAFANAGNLAVSGADHINNIEQIVISNPVTGNYDLKVTGNAITQNPVQPYYIVYDFIPQTLVLTNPVGKERFTPSVNAFDTVYIQWEDNSTAGGTYTLEFSADNGSNWSVLSNSISATSRMYSWGVPNTPTSQGLIRITNNGNAQTQTSNAFTISTLPVVTLDAVQCQGYIKINWTAVTGATDYEVMWLQGNEMVSAGTTTGLTWTFSGLSADSTYWVTVRPRISGEPGRRANAIARLPNTGTCAGTISDNDIKIDAITAPAGSGRLLTGSALSATQTITIRIKNLDDAASAGDITASYSINGGTPVSELITAPAATISAGGTITHTFATTADLSAAGTYTISIAITKTGDPVSNNDSLTVVVKQLTNDPITNAMLPWTDNLETAADQSVKTDQRGLPGLDRYDFYNSTVYGQVRAYINEGIAYSGNRALTLDADRFVTGGNVDSLTGTFNLATFDPVTDDIRMDFRYKNHGQKANTANKVWVRGSETDNWIEVYDLYANQAAADGSYKLSGSIELADSLKARGQTFSTSTQIRWGQWGEYLAGDDFRAAGYTLDDIRIYKVTDDIQAISIDTPYTIQCGLNSTVPVKVTVRNSSNATVTNVPVLLKVDGVLLATESIASIAAGTSVQYTFTATADLSTTGNHTIIVWTALGTDTFNENDTVQTTINNLPLISTFPYLENFETSDGSWYTGGTGSTWAWGNPVSPLIRSAASGSNAWKTNRAGYYNDNELSYLYSPCFNLSALTNPAISFSLSLNIEDCGAALCDAAWMEYSTDGNTWTKLGAYGTGTNWYNKNYSGTHVWSQQNYTRWHVATTALPTSNNSAIQFRFVFDSDEGVGYDGIAVDDIHIYDNPYGIYTGGTMSSPSSLTINAGNNNWMDFLEAGKLVASVQPAGQEMGTTDVKAYLHTGSVRWSNEQYYHNRNFTIQPGNSFLSLADSVRVRLYVPDSEVETLIAATGCSVCSKPSSAYDLGVSKYSDPDNNYENGTIADNNQGLWTFMPPALVTKVPFDAGYYYEFRVNNFSEFWLNTGGLTGSQPLPVQLLGFNARKQNNGDVRCTWKTGGEYDMDHYEVELARSDADYQQSLFVKIGEVQSEGNTDQVREYGFTDTEADKSGVRYYRLRMVEKNGTVSYSAVRPVLFSQPAIWTVSPNPSAGQFNLQCRAGAGELINLRVYDQQGRVVQLLQQRATGFLQKISVDLSAPRFANGIYLLEADHAEGKQQFRLVKQQ